MHDRYNLDINQQDEGEYSKLNTYGVMIIISNSIKRGA